MKKEEKIKEAWGVILETLTDKKDIDYIISNDGYFIDEIFMHTTETVVFWCGIELTKHPFDNHKYRPKSLQGIENNNSWIKIESEEDLPKNIINYYVLIDGSLKEALYRGNNRWITIDNPYPKTTEIMKITHYQPIVKPKPPIY